MKRGFLNGPKARAKICAPASSNASELQPIKFPYGKVEKAEIPESYQKPNFILKEMNPMNPYGGSTPNAMTFTTLPLGADDNEPVTECFFFPGSKELFMNTPGFPHPPRRPARPAYRTDESAGRGKGLFATRALQTGDLVLSERPLLITGRGIVVDRPAHFTDAQYVQHALAQLENVLTVCVGRMRPAARKAFLALANSHTEDGSKPLSGIMRTNGLCLEGLRPGVEGELSQYSATCKDISRLNHSCSPNVQPRWDLPSLSYQLYAVRDISEGEELTFQYTDVRPPARYRQKDLEPYGFVCACPACTDALASDARRAKIGRLLLSVDSWAGAPQLPDDWLVERCAGEIARIDAEGLQHLPAYAACHRAAMEACICLGDAARASEWAARLARLRWAEDADDVTPLLDPASSAYVAHPLWRSRFEQREVEIPAMLKEIAEKLGVDMGPGDAQRALSLLSLGTMKNGGGPGISWGVLGLK